MQEKLPKSWIIVFIAVMAAVIGFALTSQPDEPIQPEEAKETTMEPSRAATFEGMLETGSDAIYLDNQTAGQSEVIVGYVVLSQPGFVVIAADNDGVPGERVGTSRWMDNGGEHVSIGLDQALELDQVYYAVVHHDNGDGAFNVTTDPAATDAEDSVVLMTFLAWEDAVPEPSPVMP